MSSILHATLAILFLALFIIGIRARREWVPIACAYGMIFLAVIYAVLSGGVHAR